LSEEDKKLIRKAFDVSVEHIKNNEEENQGRPIFSILLLWQNSRFRNRLGATSIAAALLHDVVEDTYDR
jgi:GTP pyrophosphokinase